MSRRRFFGQKEVDIKLRHAHDGASAPADSVVGGCVAASAGKVGNSTPIVGQSQRRADVAPSRAGPARLLPPFRGQSVVQAQPTIPAVGPLMPATCHAKERSRNRERVGALMPSMTGIDMVAARARLGEAATS